MHENMIKTRLAIAISRLKMAEPRLEDLITKIMSSLFDLPDDMPALDRNGHFPAQHREEALAAVDINSEVGWALVRTCEGDVKDALMYCVEAMGLTSDYVAGKAAGRVAENAFHKTLGFPGDNID